MLLIADRHQRIADDTDDAFVFVNLADNLAHGYSNHIHQRGLNAFDVLDRRQHGFHHLLGMFEAAFLHAVAVTFLASPLIGLPGLALHVGHTLTGRVEHGIGLQKDGSLRGFEHTRPGGRGYRVPGQSKQGAHCGATSFSNSFFRPNHTAR